MTDCILFDIDGTLANITHRLHFIKPKVTPGQVVTWQGEKYPLLELEEHGGLARLEGVSSWVPHKWFDEMKPNWPAFHASAPDDTPIPEMVTLCRTLMMNSVVDVIFVSGRPESSRTLTYDWLKEHVFLTPSDKRSLWMRPDGDHRPDYQVKREILDNMRSAGWNPLLAIDDRQRVVDMWRANGVRALQCAKGAY